MKDLSNYIYQNENSQYIIEKSLGEIILSIFDAIKEGFKSLFEKAKDKWDKGNTPTKEECETIKDMEDDLNDSTKAAVDNAIEKLCKDKAEEKRIHEILEKIRDDKKISSDYSSYTIKKVKVYVVFVKLAKLSQDTYERSSQLFKEIKSLITDLDIKGSKDNLQANDFSNNHEGRDPVLQTVTEYILKMSLALGPDDEFTKKLFINNFMSGVQTLICTQMALGFSDERGVQGKEFINSLDTIQYILADIFGFKNISFK